MSRIPVASRDYNLRFRGNAVKFPKDGSDSTVKCSNCVTLLTENDRLRRQISILSEQLSVRVPFSDSSLVPELPQVADNCEHSANQVNNHDDSIKPYNDLCRGVFKFVDTDKLDKETQYTHQFANRSVSYYGDFPYAYNGGLHNTRPLSDNPYLKSILERLQSQYPNLKFNSAMITRYLNGQQGIPFHSDNEKSISPGSIISTLSFGATRTLKFRSIISPRAQMTEVELSHGDILFMTRQSQNNFEHSLLQDTSEHMRLSITLRQIDGRGSATMSTPSDASSKLSLNMIAPKEIGPSIIRESSLKNISQVKNIEPSASKSRSTVDTGKSLCVYISSSMFSKLEGEKLSSKYHEAHVFSYPGATANAINERFQSDARKNTLNANNVKSIVLMCGTNDVDSILNSPRKMRTKLLCPDSFSGDARALDSTNNSIEKLILSLHKWAPGADIKIVNVLPRESFSRNRVITDINEFISNLQYKYTYVKLISTEKNRFLFSDKEGFRKSSFFSRYGEDNVHLNDYGIVKLARHLKYHAHH